jgi:hypothetical protein
VEPLLPKISIASALRAASHRAGDVIFGFSFVLVIGVAIVTSPFLLVLITKISQAIS